MTWEYRIYTKPKYGIILGLCDGNINNGIHAQLLTRNLWLHKIKRIKQELIYQFYVVSNSN